MSNKKCIMSGIFVYVCLLSSCSSGVAELPDLDISSAVALKQTQYSRSDYYSNLYPDIDNSQLTELPVYTYCEYIEEMSEKKISGLLHTLDIENIGNVYDSVNCVGVSLLDNEVQSSKVLSEILWEAVAEIEYTYQPETDSIILSEGSKESISSAFTELAEILGYGRCVSFDIRREQLYKDGENMDAYFSVRASYANNDIETERDRLLYYYDLLDKLEISIQIRDGDFQKLNITQYDTDCLNTVGEYNVIPADKAVGQNTSGNIYVIYVLDENGYIRPVYTNQDYYELGDLESIEHFRWAESLQY